MLFLPWFKYASLSKDFLLLKIFFLGGGRGAGEEEGVFFCFNPHLDYFVYTTWPCSIKDKQPKNSGKIGQRLDILKTFVPKHYK